MGLRVTGLNHRRAPVEVRERLAVAPGSLPSVLADFRAESGAAETVILSTCNRVEVYHVHPAEPPDIAGFLARRHGFRTEELAPLLYVHDGSDAARHLFEVVAGFDSMVPGETQVLGQARDAYHAARDAGHTGRVLNRLFQSAFAAAKKMHTETALAEISVSVPSVATRLAGKVFTDLSTKTLLILGAGETGRLTLESFRERGVKRFLVVNRTVERAQALSAEAFGLDEMPAVFPRADLVIACITAEGYAITPDHVRTALRARRQAPILLLDLGVPRNVHPDVNRLDNVYLFDVDDLQEIVRQNLREREKEIGTRRPLLEHEALAAMAQVDALDVQRVLARLREACHRIGGEEAQKTLSKLQGLDPAARDEVAYLVERVINRILHTPTTALKAEARNGDSFALIELAARLFGLTGEEPKKR
ncbi:MAG: glutamyl-tRNA reductase [Planctomycetes bacterium]|nr:glutamyl-tRNA reductase [Planctomycetota bacterium]